MSRIVVRREFKHAYGGVNVRTIGVGTILADEDEAVPAALKEGCAEREQALRDETAATTERNAAADEEPRTGKRGRGRNASKS